MSRRRSLNPFTTVRSEGGLLPPELLQRVVDGDRALPGLAAGDYHLAPSERLNERISRSWNRLVGLWTSFAPSLVKMEGDGDAGTGPTRERWLLPLFTELDFGRLQPAKAEEIDGKSFPVSHRWGLQLPIHLVGAGVDLDHRSAGVAGAANASPHGLVQELLNRTDALWGLVSNGRLLRLLRDNASLTRQAYVEFDLEAMMSGEVYADFALLFLLLHESRFEAERPAESLLEQWVQAAQAQGTRVREQLRTGVEKAIETLGAGFLANPANSLLREKLRSGDLGTPDYYRQLLRLVYRLIFLFVAEDRDLLHPPDTPEEHKATYQNCYSTHRVRNLAERRRGTRHPDLFEMIKVVTTALGRDEGALTLGLPFLGGYLFSLGACPDLDGSSLANMDLLGAVRALAFTVEDNVLRPADYRNLGSEELGSVYESLLELHPEIDAEAATFSLTTAAGNERKTTGSYYTPTQLIAALLDSALDAVLAEAMSKPDPEAALLELKVLDPACGSGHFLAAAAHRIARRLAAVRTGEDEPSPAPYRTALRDAISSCVYGIDVNPMAVELCKVSLWMEAVDPGKPLSFLDHHIVCGNSLLGTTPKLLADGIPDEAFAALADDDKKVVSEMRKRNRQEREGQQLFDLGVSPTDLLRPVAQAVDALEHLPADSSQGLHEKERRWSQIEQSTDLAHAKLLADAWCAAFVMPKTRGAPAVTDGVLRLLTTDPSAGGSALRDAISDVTSRYRLVHPHLAFPGVFRVPSADEQPENPETGWSGGFDLVISNPPWEKLKLSEKEFFSTRSIDIASSRGAARKALIQALQTTDPDLWQEYRTSLRQADAESHLLRASNRFPLSARGDLNTYAIFAELMFCSISASGRAGAILPTGIATDEPTRHLFEHFVNTRSLASLFGFENEARVFPAVHHATKFCLLTLTGPDRPAITADFVFFCRQAADITDDQRRFSLSPEQIAKLNPNTRTCPVFRTLKDAELTAAIYDRLSPLVQTGRTPRNLWDIELSTMFHMTNDSALFRTAEECEAMGAVRSGNTFRTQGGETWVPLYEGKMIQQFTHRWGDFATKVETNFSGLPTTVLSQLADPNFVVTPRYWVRQAEVLRVTSQTQWQLGFRKVTNAGNERTLVASAIPVTAVGDSLALISCSQTPELKASLLAGLCSFACDYVARQKLGGTNLNFFIVYQLPLPGPEVCRAEAPWDSIQSIAGWLRPRVLELVYTAWDLIGFADDLSYGGPPFRWDESRRAVLRAEIDACFFHLFGFDRGDVEYAMLTFPIVRRKDEAEHGQFRTAELILEAFDAMANAAATGDTYTSPLEMPAAEGRWVTPPVS